MTRKEIIESTKVQGGMYAVIPSVVMLDDQLSISARMLYGVIVWTCNQNACTWASNRALGAYMGLSPKRISELIAQLEKQGHIETEVVRNTRTKEIEHRYIYPVVKSSKGVFCDRDTPIPKIRDTSPETSGDPIPKNQEVKEPNINNKNIPPYNPPKGDVGEKKQKAKGSKYDLAEDAKPLLRAYVGDDQELARALADLIEMRRDLRAINSARAIKALLNELTQYSGGSRANQLALINKAITSSWKSIYPMKPGELPEPVSPALPEDRPPEKHFVGVKVIDGQEVAVYE